MQNESGNSGRDIPESDQSRLGAELAEPHITVFTCKLDLETKKKLYEIMVDNDHGSFRDTFQMLIDLEYDRIQESTHADV